MIRHEPLSWELLDFWRAAAPGTICAIERAPIMVGRDAGGLISGFAAIGNGELAIPDCVVLEPLVARSLHTGLAIMDAMEEILREAGYVGYLFYTDSNSAPDFAEQIKRCGVFTELGMSPNGAEWFRRDFVEVRDERRRSA